jgi:hypothetical protein
MPRAAEPHHQRPGPDQDAQDGDGEQGPVGQQQRPVEGTQVERVVDRPVALLRRPGGQRHDQQQHGQRPRHEPPPPAPAGRRRRPGRRQQQHQAEQRQRQQGGGRVVHGHPGGGRQRPGPDLEPVGRILPSHPGRAQREAAGQQQPADRVPGPAAGQHGPDRGRTHRCHRRGNRGIQWVEPARPPQQDLQPEPRGQAEYHQHPQRPRQPSRPPACPSRSTAGGHPPGSRRTLALPPGSGVVIHHRQGWPVSVSAALRTPLGRPRPAARPAGCKALPPRGSEAATPHGALRAIDSSAPPSGQSQPDLAATHGDVVPAS